MAPKAKQSAKARARSTASRAGDALAITPGFQEVVERLKATFDGSLNQDKDDTQALMEKLKTERAAAQQVVHEKTMEIRNHLRKVARLQTKSKQMSDDGLLLEYRRRKLAKAKAAQSKAAKKNLTDAVEEEPH